MSEPKGAGLDNPGAEFDEPGLDATRRNSGGKNHVGQESTETNIVENHTGGRSEVSVHLSPIEQADMCSEELPKTSTGIPHSEENFQVVTSDTVEREHVQGQRRDSDQLDRQEDNELLAKLAEYLNQVADEKGQIAKDDFQKALGFKNPHMADRFFAVFDKEGLGRVNKDTLLDGIAGLTGDSSLHKLKFLFDMVDEDESGFLEADELRTLLSSCMKESALKLSEEDIDDLTLAVLESAGKDEDGAMSFEELVQLLENHPEIMENLTFSMAHWLMPSKKTSAPKPSISTSLSRYCSKRYLQNNASYVIFMLVYLLLNVALFTLAAVRYRTYNWCKIIARGNGMCLNFNAAFVLVPMLRYTLTWLRTTRVTRILPLDDSVFIHKVVGIVIFIQSVLHTLAHLGNLGYIVSDSAAVNGTEPLTYAEYLFTLKSRIGHVGPGFAYLSGIIVIVILIVMVICSSSFVRGGGHFQVFYWTHKLYIVFWVLLLLHGNIFWAFFLLPGFIYILEVATHSPLTKLITYGKTYIKTVHLLPSMVTHLVISRPQGFKFRPGDYVFINIPSIAPSEWHPFTISSAPEMEDSIWLHIRTLGNWTNRVHEHFEALKDHYNVKVVCEGERRSRIRDRRASQIELSTPNRRTGIRRSSRLGQVDCKVMVLIDGPYGTPTRDIFDTEHAVLVSTGIGITPYASILQSIMYRYKASKHVCPNCQHKWYGGLPETIMKLRKVDFIWINRDQKCFEWFVTLLAKLEMEQSEMGPFDHFLDMHLYMTSASKMNDIKSIGLQLAMQLLHQKKQVDMVTGLKTRTRPGRPDWDQLFQEINSNRKGKVKMFFCGAQSTGNMLAKKCEEYKFGFSRETF